jgi:FAD/FMN-containing dehydrogenase
VTGLFPGAGVSAVAPGNTVAEVPTVAGVLSYRDDDRAAMASDFGNLVHRRPTAVLHPRSAADIAAVVRFGRAHGLPVVPRGTGHSVDGQAQVREGIVVNMTTLAGIGEPGPNRISVDAGATWSAVVDATLPAGLAPPVLPDYLALSIGGTLSAGGIAGASHQHGCIADNVYDLDVVTRAGELVTCSPVHDRDLFDAVRGSQGEHGIIVRAALALVPVHHSARRYLLGYRDLRTFLTDQQRLIADRRFDHVGGRVQLAPDAGWRYLLEAGVAFSAPDQPDDRALLGDLGHERGTEQIASTSYRGFLERLEPLVAQLRSVGSWQHHLHPRCNVLLPGRHAESVVSDVLAGLTPELIGLGGSVLLYAVPTARLSAPNMPRARDAVTVVFGVQRTAPPDDPGLLARMRRDNSALHVRARSVGGASYANPTAYHEALHQEGAGVE